ncbi:MAG: hypothetical protein LBQ12_04555 [Deltaproteobacteria bacterium]|jgi:hypothetical protein|nr:hypothetical protein [Deltaproteobacteria bacterium]
MTKARTVILALAAALLILASGAPEASAESPVTFSGYLRIRTYALGGLFSTNPALEKVGDRYAITRLRLNVSFKPTDNIEIKWRFHGPNGARWGTTNAASDFSLYSLYFFGIIKTDWGNISVGRVSSDIDSAGLKTLGYTPSWGFSSQGWIFDRDSENDGIMYFNEWENGFGLKAFYVKRASRTPNFNVSPNTRIFEDADYDRYSVEPFYKWENGGASLALQYDRNNYDYTYGRNISATTAAPAYDVKKNYVVTINPALIQTWALGGEKTLTVHAEAKYAFGKRQPGPVNGVEQREITQDGFGAYLDFTLGYPQGDASLAAWYFRGNDTGVGHESNRPDYKDHGLVNGGEGFYPFILFNYAQSMASSTSAASLEGYQLPGHWALAILGNHKINEFVTLNYALGTFRRTNDFYMEADRKASRNMGTEADLGLTVKILDNLQWQTKFALYGTGHFYADYYDRKDYTGNIWAWTNEFLFSF